MNKIVLILVCLFGSPSFAQELLTQGPSEAQIEDMALHNKAMSEVQAFALGPVFPQETNIRPFFEGEKTAYLVMSDDDYYGYAEEMKQKIAENLPVETKLIVYTTSSNSNYHTRLKKYYSKYIDSERLIILEIPSRARSHFWSRDNTPMPVWKNGRAALVDALYYYNFEPDAILSEYFGMELSSHKFFYEGGNFMANSLGDCIVVNRKRSYPGGVSDTAAIPNSIFENLYGCQNLIRLPHLKGIGHSDEVVKFMTDNIVITDTEDYVERLEAEGFEVYLMPEPDRNYETYINALLVNKVLYVPVFGERNDQKALDIYEGLNLGLKIVPINSRTLSTRGQGSIHCITMNYPDMPEEEIEEVLKGKIINL